MAFKCTYISLPDLHTLSYESGSVFLKSGEESSPWARLCNDAARLTRDPG